MSLRLGTTIIAGYGDLSLKANVNNPIFTGVATAPLFVGTLNGTADTALVANNIPTSDVGGNLWIDGSVIGTEYVNEIVLANECNGNSLTATKWETARNLSISGDASGSVSIDGSQNVDIALVVANAINAKCIASPNLTQLCGTHESGNLTLSQPYTNFKGLLIVYASDSYNYTNTRIIWTWEIDLRRSIATANNKSWALINEDTYWICSNSSTTSIFYSSSENSIIIAIYGIN